MADHEVVRIHLGPVEGLTQLTERPALTGGGRHLEGTFDPATDGKVDRNQIEEGAEGEAAPPLGGFAALGEIGEKDAGQGQHEHQGAVDADQQDRTTPRK